MRHQGPGLALRQVLRAMTAFTGADSSSLSFPHLCSRGESPSATAGLRSQAGETIRVGKEMNADLV